MNVDVVSETVCKGQYGSGNILDTMMCASAPGKDACQVYYLIMYLYVLETAGHTNYLAFQDIPRNNRNRARNINWINPPYSESVKTNVGAKVLSLFDKHFKNSPLQ